MERISLSIEGMGCGHCTRAVTQALQGLDGVEVERVELGTAVVRHDPARLGREGIAGAIEAAGYTLREHTSTP